MTAALLLLLLVALPETVETAAPSTQGNYVIGPGDNLMISVNGLKDFEQSIRVSNSGKIRIPYLGVVSASQVTAKQLETEIAGKLRERQLVKDPWVVVQVTEFRAHPVYILGEVMQPGQFLIKREMYLVDLISLAAGFNEVASSTGYLYRRKSSPSSADGPAESSATEADEAIPIDFRKLYDGTLPELNIRLQAGDVLYVPQRKEDLFFVAGDVHKPGVLRILAGEELVASQAIARAGGPTKTAKMRKGILVRHDEHGARESLSVDFHAILTGKNPDVVLKANDILFIPGSKVKTLAYGLLGMVPGLATGAVVIR